MKFGRTGDELSVAHASHVCYVWGEWDEELVMDEGL